MFFFDVVIIINKGKTELVYSKEAHLFHQVTYYKIILIFELIIIKNNNNNN